MHPSTIGGINKLDEAEKRAIYARYIPQDLIQKFKLHDLAEDPQLLQFRFASGASDVEMRLYHQAGFQDPILYAHLTDTMNGQIHVLLYILNDPDAPRFDVDKMPDGSPTSFGVLKRNLAAELAAMQAGLSPDRCGAASAWRVPLRRLLRNSWSVWGTIFSLSSRCSTITH